VTPTCHKSQAPSPPAAHTPAAGMPVLGGFRFAELTDVTAANYKTEHDFIEALKHKINNFKKSGLKFNNAFKKS
jgi:hypothetical protein